MDTLPNRITLARIVMIPLFLLLAYLNLPWWALLVFVLACLSDFADGYLARKYDQVTNFGKFVDPLADKMLVLAAMCYFVERGQLPGWCAALVLFREFAVSGLRLIAVERQRVIAAAWSGKVKTFATMIALGLMLVFGGCAWINVLCAAVIVLTTLYSGVEYFVKNRDVLSVAQ